MNDPTLSLVSAIVLAAVIAVGAALAYSRNGSHKTLIGGAGWTLVPIGLLLTGVMELLVQGTRRLIGWINATRMTTTMWIGVGVLGLGVLLIIIAGFLRGATPAEAREFRESRKASKQRAREIEGRGRPAPASQPKPAKPDTKPAGLSDEDAEIAAILDRHGIN